MALQKEGLGTDGWMIESADARPAVGLQDAGDHPFWTLSPTYYVSFFHPNILSPKNRVLTVPPHSKVDPAR